MDLYGLIHARFIISSRGLHIMRGKYLNGVFGACPRVLCDRQLVLPVGMSEDLSISRVKVNKKIIFFLRYTARSVRMSMFQELNLSILMGLISDALFLIYFCKLFLNLSLQPNPPSM